MLILTKSQLIILIADVATSLNLAGVFVEAPAAQTFYAIIIMWRTNLS